MYTIECHVENITWCPVMFYDGAIAPRYCNTHSFSLACRLTRLRAWYLMLLIWWKQRRHTRKMKYRIRRTPLKWYEHARK